MEIRCEGVDWIQEAQDMNHCWACNEYLDIMNEGNFGLGELLLLFKSGSDPWN
jgi:hypothetical protein